MLSALVQLAVLFIIVVVVPYVVWESYKRHREQKLRENPPKQAVFELRLPSEVKDANKRMMDVWANVRSMIDPGPAERKEGKDKVTFWFDFVNNGTKQPRLRCYVYCDPERVESIKRTLRSSFDNYLLEIREVPPNQDPRRHYMKVLEHEAEQKEAEAKKANEARGT